MPGGAYLLRMLRYPLALAALLGLALRAGAQDAAPCGGPGHRAFDFWIGEWAVFDSAGRFLGRNTVAPAEDGCALTERWRSAAGFTGRSLNFLRAEDSLWHQSWVDHVGGTLSLSGGPEAGAMVLRGAARPDADGGTVRDRITWTPKGDGRVVQRWDRERSGGREAETLFLGTYRPVATTLWDVAWSPDGERLVVGGDAGVLHLLDARTLEETARLDLLPAHGESSAQRLRWHPDGRRVAVAGAYGMPSGVWTPDSGRWTPLLLATVDARSRAVAWMPDGRLVVAGYEERLSFWHADGRLDTVRDGLTDKSFVAVDVRPADGAVLALSEQLLRTGPRGTLQGRSAVRAEAVLPLAVRWSPSGERYALGDYGDMDRGIPPLVQVRDADGRTLWSDTAGAAPVRNVAWSPDGRRLAAASDRLRIWSADGALLHVGDAPAWLWGLDWSPDGTRLVTSDDVGNVRIWNAEARPLQGRPVLP